MTKIIEFENASKVIEGERASGKKVVHCHGTFDLIHPGHVNHLQEARALGDILVVTVTGQKFVNKGPGRPYFNDELRANTLAALSCVDYVVVVPYPAAIEAIECIKADIYCKGREYENPKSDVTGNIDDDVRSVASVGGVVKYVGSIVFSSTRLLNNNFDHLSPHVKEFCRDIANEFGPDVFRDAVDSFGDLNVLVIGDTIFDRYSYVNVQGLTSKSRILSGRFLGEDTQAGGALAVWRHVKQFARTTRFVSLVGTEQWVDPFLAQVVEDDDDFIVRDREFTTIVKQRYAEPLTPGKELSKLFSVNYIDAGPLPEKTRKSVAEIIHREIRKADVVLLCDFGHGMMQPEIRELVQRESKFLALNCQTNSNNHGFNIVSRQYEKADAFTLDEQELMLAAGHRYLDFPVELEELRTRLGSEYAWLTRGPVQTLGIHESEEPSICPPLETNVIDPVGAGDAFFAVAALSAAKKLPIKLGTFIGQLGGAQAVKFIGNQEHLSKSVLLKTGMSLLSF